MTSNPTIKQITTDNLPAFGEVLQHRFITDYPNLLKNSEYDNPNWWRTTVFPAIIKVYKALGMDISALGPTEAASGAAGVDPSEEVIKAKVAIPELPVPVLKPTDYRVADVIKTSDNHFYAVTGLVGGVIRTFPSLRYPDSLIIDPLSPTMSHEAFRPDISKIDSSVIEKFITETIPDILTSEEIESGTFNATRTVGEESGNLQIGDLIFAVDPIQISFSTQNGYHFFPTLRTNGQPKLPTMQQIKNIHVVLIFPNENAINNQLIPLYAMFRRTPFVNIKNKDISAFFDDIRSPNGWIPVALEGIHIQSVDGFPNSLQADISLLPFESRFLGGSGFKALRSLNDVLLQQQYSYGNTEADYLDDVARYNMRDEETIQNRWEDLIVPGIQSTENFKESLPFRAFYQSMIEDRKVVKDEYGEDEKIVVSAGVNTMTSKDITPFRPTKSENRLRRYVADHNRGLLSFKYRYVQGDLRELQKDLSFKTLDRNNERLDRILDFIDKVGGYKDLANVMFTTFHDYKDALRDFEYAFGKAEQLVNRVLASHGYDTTIVPPVGGSVGDGTPLRNIFTFIYRSLLHSTNIAQFYGAFQTLKELDLNDFENNRSAAYDLLSDKGLLYNDLNNGEISTYGIKSIDQAFRELWAFIEEDDTDKRKRDIFLIMNNIANEIKEELGSAIVPLEEGEDAESTTYVERRLPMTTEEVVIDNMQDVITSWSLTYSNKFVPINLESFKYPFYQHLGSNDAQIGLRVRSVEGSNDLKAELSKMSDKIYDSVKLIMHHAPDLYTWLDPRVEITAQPNHFLYAFGIRNVIMTSSNTTNTQGRPNNWDTTISLTQAHFNLDQYHSIEYKASTSEIEAVLTTLIPRIKFAPNGEVSVRSYNVKNDTLDLQYMMFMSFIDSDAGSRFLKEFTDRLVKNRKQVKRKSLLTPPLRIATSLSLSENPERFLSSGPLPQLSNLPDRLLSGTNITGTELAQIIWDNIGKLQDTDLRANDAAATNALREIILRYPRFGEILKAIISSYEELLEKQADSLLSLITVKKDDFHVFVENMAPKLLNIGVASGAQFVGILLISLVIPGGFLLSAARFSATTGTLIYQAIQLAQAYGDAKATLAFQSLRDRMAVFFFRMVNMYKREILLNLAHNIVKDPPIRDRLLTPAIVYAGRDPGNEGYKDLRQTLRDMQDRTAFQCYKDFDIPVKKQIGENSKRVISLSPDFYLLSPEESKIHSATFVRDNTERLLKAGKLSMMTTLVEHEKLIKRFDRLLTSLGAERDEKGNVNINSADKFGFTIVNKIADELNWESNTERSLIEIHRRYNAVVSTDQDIRGTGDLNNEIERNSLGDNFIDQNLIESSMKQYKEANPPPNDDEDDPAYKQELNFIESRLKLGLAPKIENRDLLKLNFIWAQRMLTLIEILEIYTAVISYLSQKPIFEEDLPKNEVNELFKKLSLTNDKQLLGGSENILREMRAEIGAILRNYDSIRSDSLNKGDDNTSASNSRLAKEDKKAYDKLLKKYDQGVYRGEKESDTLSLPGIRVLQNHLYNKIGYYIRLNTAIDHYNGRMANGKAPRISLDTLPEIKFLEYWNVRAAEANFRKLEIMKQYVDSLKRRKRPTMRMFPTFKLFFIEEDGTHTQLLDDYYAYNAVQSIELIKNKNMASTTAVLRLSNIMGTITDQFAFHRERNEYSKTVNPDIPDDVFFGTLDVKPGTRVQIKLGYSADERELTTVFNGRIIDMNSGPVTEMICQSYGAQLNHEIYAHKFGLLASEKEHGDIASAILDMIPGLEMLGNKDIVNLGLISGFSGKDLKKLRKNLFDNYLMSNILGRTSASLTNSDNPRDENIYLPYDLSPYPNWKPNFSWIVYQQSVWDAIREIALYHRNVCTVIRPYNTDHVSSRADERETIVVGDKSGYYKYTDSYTLSSLDTDKMTERIEQWGDILKSNIFLRSDQIVERANSANDKQIKSLNYLQKIKLKLKDKVLPPLEYIFTDVNYGISSSDLNIESIVSARLKPEYLPLWNFLSDKLNSTILTKHLADNLNIEIRSLGDLAKEAVASKLKSFGTPIEAAIDALHMISDGSDSGDPTIKKITNNKKMGAFFHFIYLFNYFNRSDVPKGGRSKGNFWQLSPDQFYGIRLPVDNTSQTLLKDPRYKKIQQHHLVSDSFNLISNNISLNASFANMVNLWYLDNPEQISNDGIPPDKWDKLNIWTTKAFRDTRDEHSRPLNSFQKNIDPNWKDIATANEDFFGGYKRLMIEAIEEKNSTVKKEAFEKYVQELNPEFGAFNLKIPDWRMFPSYVLVGINLLKQQVETMYRGSINIVGDLDIEPMDIVHLEDYTNDIHGPIEVEEVIHTFTPDNGLRTTITPCLITYDRDPIQLEDVGVINRIYNRALKNRAWQIGKAVVGIGLTAGSIMSAFAKNWRGLEMGVYGIPLAYNGIMGSTVRYHRFLYEQMGNIMGGDVINFTGLIRKGAPFICGFDGLDYASLKTVINHQVGKVDGFINRLTAFSDPFSAVVNTNWNPQEFGIGKMLANQLGLFTFSKLPNAQAHNTYNLLNIFNLFSDFAGF